MHWGAFVVSVVAGLASNILPTSTHIEQATDVVNLTLSSQTVWQDQYGWCSFVAQIGEDKGGISSRCGGAGPFGTSSPGPGAREVRRRTLSDSETTTLRKLYEAAQLFEGGHIGADHSASDLPFFILIVRTSSRGHRAVVVVVTGNPTFSSGPRKALFDWLIRERQAITP